MHTNPFPNNPHYKHNPKTSHVVVDGIVQPGVGGSRVHTQDVKSNEVITDEPKKRRKVKRVRRDDDSRES